MSSHPHHSALIRSSQPSISQLLTSLRRTTLTIHNRLTSIRSDAEFVARAAAAFAGQGVPAHAGGSGNANGGGEDGGGCRGRPLVANERCGSWYVPPGEKSASAYFKSTDGHERAWKFSTRRLNLHLVDLVERHDGIIIVDSTRRGKRMPDALSTTIPIWCTVLNLTLLPHNPLSKTLFLPPYFSPSTHAQITALLPSFVTSLQALNLSLPTTLTKPLRPLWITQDSSLPDAHDGAIFEEYRPVICCTASRRVVGSEVDEAGYVQGAGDDTENWAIGLTAPIFWEHMDELVNAAEEDLPSLISGLVEQHKADAGSTSSRKQLTKYISVCALPLDPTQQSSDCYIALTPESTPKETWAKSPTYMEVGLGKNKSASRNLRLALQEICDFAAKYYLASGVPEDEPGGQVVIGCESGRDVSVGTALALSCYLFDTAEKFRIPTDQVNLTKTLVKAKLGSIMTTYPDANPSRQTLQSVNSFLMDWRK